MRLFITVTLILVFSSLAYVKDASTQEIQRDYETITHTTYVLDHVIDGDTIVAEGIKIRLWGIDAPEKKSPYYLSAKGMLEQLLLERQLTCKYINKDRYERHVMHCLIDGQDIGSLMVSIGLAKNYSRYSGDYYLQEETMARAKKVGLWSDTDDTTNDPGVCAMDAMLCPDGSHVSRQGPKCEFSTCPIGSE